MYTSVHVGTKMNIWELLCTSLIGVLSASIGGYIVFNLSLKKLKTQIPDLLLNFLDDLEPELPKILAKPQVQSFVYSIGALIGNGARAGAGFGGGKGKFKFEDLLARVAGKLVDSFLPDGGGQPPGEQQPGEQQQFQQPPAERAGRVRW